MGRELHRCSTTLQLKTMEITSRASYFTLSLCWPLEMGVLNQLRRRDVLRMFNITTTGIFDAIVQPLCGRERATR
jgi:hypothetical protein